MADMVSEKPSRPRLLRMGRPCSERTLSKEPSQLGLLTRVVATFSCEDCRIELPSEERLRVGRNGVENVTLRSTGTRVGQLLTVMTVQINRHCARRGAKVTSDLQYTPVKRTVPDFVQSMSVDTSRPAVWANLADVKVPLEALALE